MAFDYKKSVTNYLGKNVVLSRQLQKTSCILTFVKSRHCPSESKKFSGRQDQFQQKITGRPVLTQNLKKN